MHDIARIVCHDLTYKYGKITPGYVPNSLVILYDISCVILQNPAFFFYKILQEFLLGVHQQVKTQPTPSFGQHKR